MDRPDGPAPRPLHRRRRRAQALESGSKSLLAIGIVEVVGEFEKGTSSASATRPAKNSPADSPITRPRTPDASAACAPTRPAQTSARPLYDEVVHRDNLVLISEVGRLERSMIDRRAAATIVLMLQKVISRWPSSQNLPK